MSCQPTETPEVDIPALREKYRQERDSRLRPGGSKQYIEAADEFADYYEIDPHSPPVVREPISEDLEVAVIGGGLAALFTAVRLRQAGVNSFRMIDWAGDFGGVWYWNRYPGIQCDNESYCYMPLLEEMEYVPKARFADGAEIRAHCQNIGRRFALYDTALFGTLVRSLRWDEAIRRWRIGTNHGDDIRARFVVMGVGNANRPKLPGIPGVKSFKGRAFHSARWDYGYTGGDASGGLHKLADKRVAVIGTGASAIQIVPFVGRDAQHLYVFQRTPSSVDRRGNALTDTEWANSLQPGWQKARHRQFHHWAVAPYPPGAIHEDAVCDLWTEINRNLSVKLEAMGWPKLAPEDLMAMREEEDYRVMERLRQRVACIVRDPATAEALKPYYRFGCKRPCSNDQFLETFNRPNVTLIDVSGQQGVEQVTETGIIAAGVEYAVDCIIYASGFEITTDVDRRFGIAPLEGRAGLSLYQHWADGFRTLHGFMSHSFPNLFFTGFIQGGVQTNNTAMYDQQGTHIAWIIQEALARGAAVVEPTEAAEAQWVGTIHEKALDMTAFQLECTPGYYNNEGGGQGPGRAGKLRSVFGEPYGPGFYAFDRLLKAWRDAGDLEGLSMA